MLSLHKALLMPRISLCPTFFSPFYKLSGHMSPVQMEAELHIVQINWGVKLLNESRKTPLNLVFCIKEGILIFEIFSRLNHDFLKLVISVGVWVWYFQKISKQIQISSNMIPQN